MPEQTTERVSTGLTGLNDILDGGLISQRAYLIHGDPGTGKSTLGYHFLREGLDNNETVLCITLGERKPAILKNALRVGIDLSDAIFADLTPDQNLYKENNAYSIFSSQEVERDPIISTVVEAVETHKPSRVFLDSITILKLLSHDPLQMRKMSLSFINYICGSGATMLMTSEIDSSENSVDQNANFWVDGIIRLEFNPGWRKISVSKFRGSNFSSGSHSFKITSSGMEVYPRLKPKNYGRKYISGTVSSGIKPLDDILQGGIEQGTITMISGPSGVGKTNLSIQFIKEAAQHNERSVIYTFEEARQMIIERSESINVPIRSIIDSGNLSIQPIEPFSYSPDEFAAMVRKDVENNNTRFVMLDSIGGYTLSVREENKLERLHALTIYLQNMGVTAFLINETNFITGNFQTSGMHASYLADNIIFLRYIELQGELKKAIGVLKKRMSDFDPAIYEFYITSEGIHIGKKYNDISGILSGIARRIDSESNNIEE